jgi:hypothetical protein
MVHGRIGIARDDALAVLRPHAHLDVRRVSLSLTIA